VIQARGLRRCFGEVVAVDDLSLCVPEGTILALLGPNGAGKTTTVRVLAGLLAPSAGEAIVAGHDVGKEPAAVRARVGLVTDVPGLHDQMTAVAYLDFFGRLYGLDGPTRRRRIGELLGVLDLRAVATTRLAGFSRGMQQKIALARALVHEPAVVFLDEPTTGLDPLAARAVRDLIVGLKHARRSVVVCTHDLDEAERLADAVAILRRGRIVACDTPAALRASAARESVVHVALGGPCDGAASIAARVGGVLGTTLLETADGPILTYRTAEPMRTNPAVVASLVGAGAAIVSVMSSTPTLEEVYAQAVGQDEHGR
jgi:ABC-2 type transport system ATP-binding protein